MARPERHDSLGHRARFAAVAESGSRRSHRSWLAAFCVGALLLSLPAAAEILSSEEEHAIQKFEMLIKGERYAEVIPLLEIYSKDHPNSWRALYQLGYACFRMHRFQESVKALSLSLILNSQLAEAHKILAYDFNIEGRQDLAIRELAQAIGIDPTSFESHYELGRIYFEEGSYGQAVLELEKARALAPDVVKTWHNLGLAYAGSGDNTRAVECFRKAIELNFVQKQPSAWPYIDYGTWCNLQNDFQSARELLVQAVRIDARFDQAFEELGKAYRGLGDLDRAIQSYQQAIAINPRKAEYHYALAQVYRLGHRQEEALLEMIQFQRVKAGNSAGK
jgi:tetratricopeptide (TPR) repeat protein